MVQSQVLTPFPMTPFSPPFDPPRWDAKMLAYGMQGGGGVVAKRRAVMARTGWRTARVSRSKRKSTEATTNPPFWSPQAQPESGVRGTVPAPFGAGERLQSPTYRYPQFCSYTFHVILWLTVLSHLDVGEGMVRA